MAAETETKDDKTETKDTKSTETKTETKSDQKMMSQKDYDALMEKAKNYELISNDPELAAKVVDHYRAKVGKTRETPPKKDETEEKKTTNNMPQEVAEQLRMMNRKQAELEIKLFAKEHPDFDQQKETMAKLLTRHPTMDLEEAYNLSKGSSSKPKQGSQQPDPEATAETNKSAGTTTTTDDFEALSKKISDPKATPRLDDAIALAWKAAKLKDGETSK